MTTDDFTKCPGKDTSTYVFFTDSVCFSRCIDTDLPCTHLFCICDFKKTHFAKIHTLLFWWHKSCLAYWRYSYCVDIHMQSGKLVVVRDGSYGLFDNTRVIEGLTPAPNLKVRASSLHARLAFLWQPAFSFSFLYLAASFCSLLKYYGGHFVQHVWEIWVSVAGRGYSGC